MSDKRITTPKDLNELLDQRFGSLVVKRYKGKNRQGHHTYVCLCDCLSYRVVAYKDLIGNAISANPVRACEKCSQRKRRQVFHGRMRKFAGEETIDLITDKT